MRVDLDSANLFDAILKSARFSHARRILDTSFVVTTNGALVNFLDPNGADRDVSLPALAEGLFFTIANVGGANNLLVKDDGGTLLATVQPGQTFEVWASEVEWQGSKASTDLDVFTNTVDGLVPAPNSGAPGSLFLRDDGQWAQVQVVGIVDAFKYMTDGTNVATGAGPDTFKIWSPDGSLSVLVTDSEAIHGDNVRLQVDEANVDHDALANYVADEHVAHSAITVTAGLGLNGGGDLASSFSLAFDPSELGSSVPALTDFAVYWINGGDPQRSSFASINSLFVHDNLTGFVADEHIAHSGVSIIAGLGLSGGGDISSSRTLNLDFTELPTDDTITATDLIPFYDSSEADHGTNTVAQLNAALDHDVLLNFVANEHINHSSITLTAGLGLTGGGDITASRSFALDPAPATAALNVFTDLLKGLVPASGGGTSTFLRADGTFAIPAGGGDLLAANNLSDVVNAATAFTNIKQAATTTATGVVELTTDAEARASSDTTRALTVAAHVAGHKPAFRAESSAAQAISASTWTACVNFTDSGSSLRFDSDNCMGASRFTPNVAGWYYISGEVNVPSSGNIGVSIWRNGVAFAQHNFNGGAATFTGSHSISAMIYFNGTTDYVELVAFTNFSGGNINSAFFAGFRLFS